MNVGKEILNLYNIPFYSDQNEFLDKVFSYLYARFKYKQLIFMNEQELSVDKDLFKQAAFIVKEQKTDEYCILNKKNISDVDSIREIYLEITMPDEQRNYLFIKLQKKHQEFERVSDLKLFLNFLKEYFSKYFMIIQMLSKTELLSQAEQASEIKETTMNAQPDIKQFYSVNANKMPEEVDLVHVLDKIEKRMIREMLKRMSGKKSVAAKKLGITERMIGYKINKYGL